MKISLALQPKHSRRVYFPTTHSSVLQSYDGIALLREVCVLYEGPALDSALYDGLVSLRYCNGGVSHRLRLPPAFILLRKHNPDAARGSRAFGLGMSRGRCIRQKNRRKISISGQSCLLKL
ncbi:hypothetical protein QQF64_026413 [Cirrhinus molitorella]|uniref:Uncharacterized protein n=1 Tax=Cirrhinus molitorella TaxID=172907 RepID=A0ABR3N9I7_9TELE